MVDGELPPIVNNAPQPNTWRELPMAAVQVINVAGMDDEIQQWLNVMYATWYKKLGRNRLKYRYYDGKNELKDFGISTPPQVKTMLDSVVGWPQKAVDSLAVRSRFDGFSAADETVQSLLDDISKRSRIGIKYKQAMQSELIQSCCFGAVKRTDDGHARIDMYDAEHATGIWDDAVGRLACGLTIESVDSSGVVDAMDMYLPDYIVHIYRDEGNEYHFEAEQHKMGVAPLGLFAYKPSMRKPFGVSRISRAVMTLTDSAVRVAVGGDISYQFAVSPQKYLLNADRNALQGMTAWEAYIGSVLAISNGDSDQSPVFGQLAQASMQQTTDYMRLLAQRFAAETNVPVAQLGIMADSNPTSAEAMYAATEALIIEAEDLNDGARGTLTDLATMAMAVELDVGYNDMPAEYYDFTAIMRNPAMPSIVSQADAMIKVASVVPAFAGTDTFFEQLGFSDDIRRKALMEIQRNESQALIRALIGQNGGAR